MQADAELLEMVRRGEPAGASALFERYSGPILRFTTRMLGNETEAEEITQDVFLKMISRVEQYDGRAAVSSWLFAIAANACRDRFRSKAYRGSIPLDSISESADPHEDAESILLGDERRRLVRKALNTLSDEQREALILARYHGLPYSEIARTLSISEGAVKTRIFRAMETLKGVFSQGGRSCRAAI